MKITDVRVQGWDFGPATERFWDSTIANPPRRGLSILEVETDEGLVGQCPSGANRIVVENGFKPLLVGEDPLLIERCWRKMFESRHTTLGGDFWFALSRIDIALWDLAGKILGQPVWKLLGGAPPAGRGLRGRRLLRRGQGPGRAGRRDGALPRAWATGRSR